jgi:hypothetical protein
MDNKKFESLIELIINEDEEQARSLFHDIVVEKSREIYENMMMDEMGDGMGGPVGQMMDEISVEESGVIEGEDEEVMDFDDEEPVGDDEIIDIEGGEGGVETRLDSIEDKLDQLMSEFEDIMSAGDAEQGEEDMEQGEEDMEQGEGDMDDESMMEAIALKKVPVTHGDNGAYTKSPALTKPRVVSTGANPVKFSGSSEAVPTSPKAPSNQYTKGETQVKGAGNFKNVPGKDNFSEKGESTPAPVKKDAASGTTSPVAESRRTTKRIVR